jgi:predicted enzyme related to lactoylglutathione lyase
MGKRNRIVHIEWRSKNVERLKQFYKKAFRWKFRDPMPGYMMVDMGNKDARGGFMQIEAGSQLQPGIMSFLQAEDLAGAEEAVRDAGGQILTSAQPVDGWGRFTIFTDPDGNQLAMWQSESAMRKAEKQAKKAARKADDQRLAAERAEKKAHKKAEKKARKAQKKATQAAAAGEHREANGDDKKKKKKKNKKQAAAAEAGGAI